MTYDRSQAIAFVAEEVGGFEDDEHLHALGLFSAHVEADDLSEGFLAGPDRVPEAEAVAWARERAARVIVRTCETWENVFYSAGEIPAKGAPYPEGGLGLGKRRLPGWEFLDRTDGEDPIRWEVIVNAMPEDLRVGAGFAHAFGRALERDAAVELVDLRFEPPAVPEGTFHLAFGEVLAVHVRVTGRTVAEATGVATRACAAAAGGGWEWSANAYPTASRAARANARLRDR